MLAVLALLLALQSAPPTQGDAGFVESVESERLAARSALAGGDRAGAAGHLYRRGRLLCGRGWYAAALDDLRSAVREALAAGDRSIELLARVELGDAARWVGLPDEALASEESALAALGREADPALACSALLRAGDACFDLNRFDEEARFFERMVATATDAALTAESALAWSRLELARLHLGDLESAEACRDTALHLAESCGDERTLAQVRLHVAIHLDTLGEHDASARMLEQVLAADIPATTRLDALGALGNQLLARGRVDDARRCYEGARAIAMELGLHAYEARFLLAFANLDSLRGDFDRARRNLEQARDLLQEPHQALERGEVLLSLGQVLATTSLERAVDAYLEVLELSRDVCDRSLESRALTSLAGCYLAVGAADPARRRALAARYTAAHGSDVGAAAAALGALAWIDLLDGRSRSAVDLAWESYRLYRLLGMDLQSLEILDTLADVAQGSGDEALCQRSVDLAHGIFDSDFLSSSDLEECARLRAKFAVWASREQALTSMKLAHPDLAPDERRRLVEAGFLMSDAWKARALLGGLTERRRGVRTPERAAALAGLEAANRSRLEILARVSSALRSGVPIERVESLVAEADAARRDADGIASRIRQAEVAIEAASADAGRTPEDLRRTLPDDRTALVEYAESNSRLQAYVVTRTSFELLDLGERDRIGSRAAEFVTGLRAESPASRDRILELAHELYGDLLKPPLAAVGGAVEQLVIVPTTLVASLPFDALVMEPAHGAPGRPARFEDAAFVVRKYTVTYAASAAVLAELAALPDRIEPRSLLAMVDPAYPPSSDRSRAGDPSPAPTLQGGGPAVAGLPRLARSREEGGRLARIFAASGTGATAEQLVEFEAGRLDTLEAERFLLLAGPEATAERFRGDAARFSILHVAAHGFADFTDPDGGALALTPRGGSSGLLTYREVLRMHLTAELTVLSACDTGLGPELAGEGVLSLARAFTLAGSRSVVASLWPVYDRQASEMMDAFYRAYLFGGASVPVALRQAKLRAMTEPGLDGREKRGGRNADSPAPQGRLAECADPWYWAAFVSLAPIR